MPTSSATSASARCTGAGSWEPVDPLYKRPFGTARQACPAILSRYSWIGTYAERSVECCGPGDPIREAAIRTNRFKSCDAANGRTPPTIETLLNALQGRTVAFVGDSTMHQLWTALIAEVFAAKRPMDVTQRVLEFNIKADNHNRDDMCTVSHSNPPKGGGSENTFHLDARMQPRCNLTNHKGEHAFNMATNPWPLRPMCESIPDLELTVPAGRTPATAARFLFYRVDMNQSKSIRQNWRKTHSHCASAYKNFEAKIEAASDKADVVMANIGVWYGETMATAYRSEVGYILSKLSALAPMGKLGLYRESIVQHFPTQSGSGLYEERDAALKGGGGGGGGSKGRRQQLLKLSCPTHCSDLSGKYATQLDWRNRILHEEVAARRFPPEQVVPVASLLRPMAKLHKMTKFKCGLDCTHYCYHPDLWAALLDGFYRRVLNWADAKPPLPGLPPPSTSSTAIADKPRGGKANGPKGAKKKPKGKG